MDKQPTEAQIKEFWEWNEAICPNCDHPIATKDKVKPYWKPNICYCHSVQLPIDLNNLFKYAVPKLDKYMRWVVLYKWIYEVDEKEMKDYTLALFWAIREVIHNEKR